MWPLPTIIPTCLPFSSEGKKKIHYINMLQSLVKVKLHSYFNYITTTKVLFHGTSIVGACGAYMHCTDMYAIHEQSVNQWTTSLEVTQSHPLHRKYFSQYLISCAGVTERWGLLSHALRGLSLFKMMAEARRVDYSNGLENTYLFFEVTLSPMYSVTEMYRN